MSAWVRDSRLNAKNQTPLKTRIRVVGRDMLVFQSIKAISPLKPKIGEVYPDTL
jgi:hypothetical protein